MSSDQPDNSPVAVSAAAKPAQGGVDGSILRLSKRVRPHRDLLLGVIDATAVVIGWIVIHVALLADHVDRGWVLPLLVGGHFVGGFATGLYRNRWSVGSFDETVQFWLVTALTAIVVSAACAIVGDGFEAVEAIAALFVGALISGFVRAIWRRVWERHLSPGPEAVPVLVIGSDSDGERSVKAMMIDPASQYRVVGILDDDPRRAHRLVVGIPVMGTIGELAAVQEKTKARHVLVANPNASIHFLRQISALAKSAGIDVLTLPSVRETFGDDVRVSDIRPLREVDLLNRREVNTDLDAIGSYLRGKRVLVTGAGGSIGSELCRQLHTFQPASLLKLDRDESGLHATQLSIEGHALLNDPNLIVADIRDSSRLMELFALHRPDIVFHAAALKHLPLLEMHPSEAWKTNVLGTLNVLEAAASVNVECFVNISTDKAANPVSILGYSKRTAERLTSAFAGPQRGRFLSVRFGNVLGSRGSMLETFREQLKRGEPLTVTHPDITRFFMTVEEAVQLLIQAGAIGRSNEVLILDMGEPVRIADVAQRMAATVTPPAHIKYVGLRPNEKMHEELFGPGEKGERPIHPLISHVPVPPLSLKALQTVSRTLEGLNAREALIDLSAHETSDTQNAR